MANELNIPLSASTQSGLSASARLFAGGQQVGGDVALVESPAGSAYYRGSVPAGTPAAYPYSVVFVAGGSLVGGPDPLYWDGGAEVAERDAFAAATRVRLLAEPVPASNMRGTDGANTVAPDNAAVAAIKAKTDLLPAQPAAAGSAMTLTAGERTSVAAAVWAATTRGLTTYGTLAADAAVAVWSSAARSLTDKLGFELSAAEREVTASTVEAHLMDEGDGQALLDAIQAKIEAADWDNAALIASIRADLERAGGLLAGRASQASADAMPAAVRANLATELARLDAAVSSRSTFAEGGGVVATNMRGTDDALPAAAYVAPDNVGIGNVTSAVVAIGLPLQANDPRLPDPEAGGDAARLATKADAAAGGNAGGVSAAEVWGYPGERTLTSVSSPLGAGLSAPAAASVFVPGRGQRAATARGVAADGSAVVLLGRPLGINGDRLRPADVSAASLFVRGPDGDETTSAEEVAGILSENLRLDGRWDADEIGYSLAVIVSGSRLSEAAATYRATLLLATAAGPVKVRWEIQTD